MRPQKSIKKTGTVIAATALAAPAIGLGSNYKLAAIGLFKTKSRQPNLAAECPDLSSNLQCRAQKSRRWHESP